jgi:hypothetical protein
LGGGLKLIVELDEPDLKIAGLSIWIHGRQFENAEDYWDGNWLRATAHCGAEGAEVTISGSFLHLPELTRWAAGSRQLLSGAAQFAELPTIEPELTVQMKMATLGHITMEVEITPNHLQQQHKFTFEIDQTYLPRLIRQIETVEARYPTRGTPQEVRTGNTPPN